jgi:4-amino-4-deoxy-L-arabinose transferase-like glycosyltransferase
MFQFPYYQDVEGTNVSNAWSLLTEWELSPYTYAYEEPPLGSFLLTFWAVITGGLNSFGSSADTGRALMLVIHALCTALVFGIARKASRSDLIAILAALIFTFSPLVTILQRRVLLDNIMIFWVLMALYMTLGEKRKLTHYLASAVFFGLAVLSKGAAIFFLPAFVYIIRLKADAHHKRFATNLWMVLATMLILFYPLYAQMKQELFPQGWLLGGDFPHVSLVERMMDRGPDTGRFLDIGSGLRHSFNSWTDISHYAADPVLIYAGIIGTVFVVLLSIDNRRLRPLVAMTVAYCVYLLFGGQVFDSDIIALLPLLAINAAIVIGGLTRVIANTLGNPVLRYSLGMLILAVLLYPFWVFYSDRIELYELNQVDGQIAALNWINENIPNDAVIVMDNYAFVELRQSHPAAHHYWRVDTDPDIKFNFLDDDQCNIDYMLATPQVINDVEIYGMDLMLRALRNSEVIRTYPNNGWPIEIRQVRKVDCTSEIAGGERIPNNSG